MSIRTPDAIASTVEGLKRPTRILVEELQRPVALKKLGLFLGVIATLLVMGSGFVSPIVGTVVALVLVTVLFTQFPQG